MLISIIVPVYKTEKYLEECVESVISQSYSKWEMILVDDGSPDNCPQICDRYAEEDNRITVIHKANGGLSSARNRGIDSATGDYIVFLDSDDVLLPNAIETIAGYLVESPDVLITEMYNTTDVTAPVKTERLFDISKTVSKKNAISFVFTKKDLTWPAQQYIVKRLFIQENDLRFEEGYYHEDVDWTATLFAKADTFAVCNLVWYIHRCEREGSITNVIQPKRTSDMIMLVSNQIEKKGRRAYDRECEAIVFNQLVKALLSSMIHYNAYDKKEKDAIAILLDKHKKILFRAKSLKHKVFAICVWLIGTDKTMMIYGMIR